jgi:hypothetical protein
MLKDHTGYLTLIVRTKDDMAEAMALVDSLDVDGLIEGFDISVCPE